MVRAFDTRNVLDFTGGLNLEPDQFKLAVNESPDLLNVDISYRGGVAHRAAFKTWANSVQGSSPIVDMHPWVSNPTGACVVTTTDDGKVRRHKAGYTADWQDQFDDPSRAEAQWREKRSAAEFKGNLYLSGRYSVIRLSPYSDSVEWVAPMSTANEDFNGDLDNPVGGKMPAATVVASWQGSMWAANIREDINTSITKTLPTRLRWSHPNYPEDWHVDHYIDLEDDGAGAITALVPDGDRLLVIRENGIHAVVGAPPEALSVYQMSDTLGCSSPSKVAQTPHGVYLWTDDRGLYRIGQQSIEWVFEKLYPALLDGRLNGREAVVTWGGDRLYVKVEYSDRSLSDQFRSWFVLDPTLGPQGAWTRHAFADRYDGLYNDRYGPIDMPASCWFEPPNGQAVFVTAAHGALLYRAEGQFEDEDFMGVGRRPNRAWFRTAWLDLGQPGQKKRWRRAEVIGSGNPGQTLHVQIFRDYNPLVTRRDCDLALTVEGTDGARYDTAIYGEAVYVESNEYPPVMQRTPPLGLGRAVQLQFTDSCDPQSLEWRIDSLVYKYTPYRVRK